MDRIEIREKLEKKLTKKRYEHSLGVEYTAGCMAMVHGVDIEEALTAGLLHDCAKCISSEEKIERCQKLNLPISDVEYKNPELLHAKLGAYYARTKYNIENKDILSAIEYHTTGRPAMNILEKIIFVADYIEPNRKPLEEIDEIRREAFTDLDKCIVHILRNTLSYLDGSDADTDQMSIDTYNYYVKKQC
ncbi:MAG: bis(5'-nucleosyl)-tetraphosphatase (symmetrical) YqeK [Coprococcus sp.]